MVALAMAGKRSLDRHGVKLLFYALGFVNCSSVPCSRSKDRGWRQASLYGVNTDMDVGSYLYPLSWHDSPGNICVAS